MKKHAQGPQKWFLFISTKNVLPSDVQLKTIHEVKPFLSWRGVLFLFLFYYLFILQSNAQCGKTLGNVNYFLNNLLFTRSRCYKYQGLLLNKARKANHSYISLIDLLLDLFSSVYFWSGTDTNMIGHHLVDQISEKASWVKKQTNTALKSSKNEQRIFVLNR